MKLQLLLLICFLVPVHGAFSQSSDFHIEISADPLMDSAQIVELTSLINSDGNSTNRLFTIQATNESAISADDLYLDIELYSSADGLLMESHQRNDTPFGLQPGETATISNVDLSRQRLPNSQGPVTFNGNLTPEGRDLLNRLQGVTTLPADEYTIRVRLFKRNNSVNGGLELGSDSVTFGSNLVDSDFSITLIAPGEPAGSSISISNSNPVFRWDGDFGQNYRLILVSSREQQDPETVIESAISSQGSESGGENLLDEEYLDVYVDGTTFTYPSFGVRPLEPGQTYHWQVFSELQTTTGTTERASEIWSFTYLEDDINPEIIQLDDDLRELLMALIGVEQTERIEREGFELFEIEMDGQIYSGNAAKEKLLELLEKLQSNKIKMPD